MKKAWFFVFLSIGCIAFAQQRPIVAVATFDVMGGVTTNEAQVITELFITELVSNGTVGVVSRADFDRIATEMRFQTTDWANSQRTAQLGRAIGATHIIRGQLMRMDKIYWTATMIDVNTAQVLASAREEINNLGEIYGKLSGFCSQFLSRFSPLFNYAGRWHSVADQWSAILEFRENGSINVIQYQFHGNRYNGTGSFSITGNRISIVLNLVRGNETIGVNTSSEFTVDELRTRIELRSSTLYSLNSCSQNRHPYTLFVKGN